MDKNKRLTPSLIERILLILLVSLSFISIGSILYQKYYVTVGGGDTWITTTTKLLSTVISPFKTKKSSQSIIQSLDGPPSEIYIKAINLQSEKNFTESLSLLIQAYESANKLYGSDNEKTIFLLSELAKAYKTLGRNLEAAKYYQEAVDNVTKSGIEPSNTLEILRNLSAIYINVIGDFTKALPVQVRVVSIEEGLEDVTNL
jgi:tetratricopeptide (TPR) repeat protein